VVLLNLIDTNKPINSLSRMYMGTARPTVGQMSRQTSRKDIPCLAHSRGYDGTNRAGYSRDIRRFMGKMVHLRSCNKAVADDTQEHEGKMTSVYGFVKKPAKGGVIVEIDGSDGVEECFLPWQEAPISINKKVKKHETMKELMPLGLQREFVVCDRESGESGGDATESTSIVLSAKGIDEEILWKRIEQIYDHCSYEKENFSVVVNGVNKGGLTAFIAGYPVFVPISQLKKQEDGSPWDVQTMQSSYMKKRIRIAMLEVNAEDRRVVCSELKAVENDLIRQLEVGQVIQGRIRKTEKFGVFVGIQGTRMSALLHVSNISKQHVDHPEDVFESGETIHAMIIGMNEDYSNISLSTAVLEEVEGDMLRDKKHVYSNATNMAETFMKNL
jgi:small subunit ribosomal protein S1